MARLAIVHERTAQGDWRPVGVILGTTRRLDFRFLPNQRGWQAWAENTVANASPPYRDGTGLRPERGTWEDWVPWAVGAFSNGHDTWLTLIDDPEPTLDANYERYVLDARPREGVEPPEPTGPEDLPELGGFRKVTTSPAAPAASPAARRPS